MKTAIDFYFFVNVRFRGSSFSSFFSFTELATNSGHLKDTELFYSLHDEPDVVKNAISSETPVCFQANRNISDEIGYIFLVEPEAYQKWFRSLNREAHQKWLRSLKR